MLTEAEPEGEPTTAEPAAEADAAAPIPAWRGGVGPPLHASRSPAAPMDDGPYGFEEEINNRYEEISAAARTWPVQQMTIPLLKVAKEEGLTEYTGLKKQDLIFKILKER